MPMIEQACGASMSSFLVLPFYTVSMNHPKESMRKHAGKYEQLLGVPFLNCQHEPPRVIHNHVCTTFSAFLPL